MANKSLLTILITLANIAILILAIIIMFLSLGNWNDYTTCTFTILVALCWACCACMENNVALSCYTVLMVIDMLLLLANAIFYTVMTKKYNDACFDEWNLRDGVGPTWGCHEWRPPNGGMIRTVGMLVCFYIAFALRLFNIFGSCLLARSIYESN